MNIQSIINNAIDNGILLINYFPYLEIETELRYKSVPSFSTERGKIHCFVGTIGDELMPVMGCTQTYIISKEVAQNGKLLHQIQVVDFGDMDKKEGFGFEKMNETSEWQHYLVHLFPFYQAAPMPTFIRKWMSKAFPMSAYVVINDQLNTPLNEKSKSSNFCYAFTNERSGPSFFGFGPGKFEKAFKHYSLSPLEDGNYELVLTGIISPRSKKMMNFYGFDPAYSFLKVLDFITFRQLNIFQKQKAQMELTMMKIHADVHELMLEYLLDHSAS